MDQAKKNYDLIKTLNHQDLHQQDRLDVKQRSGGCGSLREISFPWRLLEWWLVAIPGTQGWECAEALQVSTARLVPQGTSLSQWRKGREENLEGCLFTKYLLSTWWA